MICSSVNLDRFIRPSLPVAGLYFRRSGHPLLLQHPDDPIFLNRARFICPSSVQGWTLIPLEENLCGRSTPQFSICSSACFGMKRAVGDGGCGDDRSDTA